MKKAAIERPCCSKNLPGQRSSLLLLLRKPRIKVTAPRQVGPLVPRDESPVEFASLWLDEQTTPVTFWTGSNHDHALVKVEPLD